MSSKLLAGSGTGWRVLFAHVDALSASSHMGRAPKDLSPKISLLTYNPFCRFSPLWFLQPSQRKATLIHPKNKRQPACSTRTTAPAVMGSPSAFWPSSPVWSSLRWMRTNPRSATPKRGSTSLLGIWPSQVRCVLYGLSLKSYLGSGTDKTNIKTKYKNIFVLFH